MSSKNCVIRVYHTKDPSLCEYTHTNNPNQRRLAIQADIKAVKGLTQKKKYARWDKFQSIPLDEIAIEVFTSSKVSSLFSKEVF